MRKAIFTIIAAFIFFINIWIGYGFSCLDYFDDDYDLSYKSINGLIEYQDESKEVITKFYLELDLYGGSIGKSIEELENLGLKLTDLSISTTEGVSKTAYPKDNDYENMGVSVDTVFEGKIDLQSWKELYDRLRFRIEESNGGKYWRKFFSFKEKAFILIRENDLGWGKIISRVEKEGFSVLNIRMKADEKGCTVVGVWVEKRGDKSLRGVVEGIGEELGIENVEKIIKVTTYTKKAREEYNEFFEKGIFILGEKIVGFFRYLLLEY